MPYDKDAWARLVERGRSIRGLPARAETPRAAMRLAAPEPSVPVLPPARRPSDAWLWAAVIVGIVIGALGLVLP